MGWSEEKERLAEKALRGLYEKRMIRTFYRDKREGWTLISGMYSPLYIQLRPMISHPELFSHICHSMAALMEEEAPEINAIVGIAMAGIPLASGMALKGNMRACFTRKIEGARSVEDFRKLVTSYGEHSLLEGEIFQGDRIAVVDDLVTRFDSKLVAMEQVKMEAEKRGVSDVDCSTVIVVVDREQGGEDAAHKIGATLKSLIKFKSWGLDALREVMDPYEWRVISDYLEDPARFQSKEARLELASASRADSE
jgi:orotate phosphoribosyltransferase